MESVGCPAGRRWHILAAMPTHPTGDATPGASARPGVRVGVGVLSYNWDDPSESGRFHLRRIVVGDDDPIDLLTRIGRYLKEAPRSAPTWLPLARERMAPDRRGAYAAG